MSIVHLRCRAPRDLFVAFILGRSAVAAVEFAILMPVFLMFTLAGAETARYIYVMRKVEYLATSLATLVTERQISTNMTALDTTFVFNSAMVTMPEILSDAYGKGENWSQDIQMTLSSISFKATPSGCTSSCTYQPTVVWSVANTVSLKNPPTNTRSCTNAPQSVSDTATPSLTALPADAFQAGTLIVADVVFVYTPRFGSGLVPTLTIRRSAYLQPRYLTQIGYTGVFGVCPASS